MGAHSVSNIPALPWDRGRGAKLALHLHFIGPGGGSAAVRKAMPHFPTGGFQVKALVEGKPAFTLLVDPGPGIVGKVPERVENLFISHVHTDHYGGARVAVESMERHGFLFAPRPVLKALGAPEGFHLRRFDKDKRVVLDTGIRREGRSGPLSWTLEAVEAQHYDEAYGFLLTLSTTAGSAEVLSLYYTSDTGRLSPEALEKAHVVVANVPFIDRENEEYHLTYQKVAEAVSQQGGGKVVVLSHVGNVVVEALAENRERWERLKAFIKAMEKAHVVVIPQAGTALAVYAEFRPSLHNPVPHTLVWRRLSSLYRGDGEALRRRVELY